MKNLILLIIAMIPSCGPEHYETIDMGKIPSDILTAVPYQSGEVAILEHSNGKQIHYDVERITHEREDYFGHGGGQIIYEENITTLTPDHPVFSVALSIANQDTVYYSCNIWMNGTSFSIPISDYENEFVDIVDSLLIAETYYFDVFKLANSYNYGTENPIRIDSLYYNFTHGILKITMSNDEYYQIVN